MKKVIAVSPKTDKKPASIVSTTATTTTITNTMSNKLNNKLQLAPPKICSSSNLMVNDNLKS